MALVIDITGFTALTERLAKRGPGGAETLASMLDESFGDVIERIYARGGDVVSFPGDAIIAVWTRAADDLSSAVASAATCALEGQRLLEARPPVEGSLRSRPGWDRHRRHVGRDRRRGRRRMALGRRRTADGWRRSGSGAGPARRGGADRSRGRRWQVGGRTVEGDPGHMVIGEVMPPAAGLDEAPADADTAGEPTLVPLTSFWRRSCRASW